MQNNRSLGSYGEKLAADFLVRSGYVIRLFNYRCMYGEIDIIAEKNDELIFVEVKLRKNLDYGMPREAVTKKKQKAICNAAKFYLSENNIEYNARFDVIEIILSLGEPIISHVQDAFWDSDE